MKLLHFLPAVAEGFGACTAVSSVSAASCFMCGLTLWDEKVAAAVD